MMNIEEVVNKIQGLYKIVSNGQKWSERVDVVSSFKKGAQK